MVFLSPTLYIMLIAKVVTGAAQPPTTTTIAPKPNQAYSTKPAMAFVIGAVGVVALGV